jgi:hypothetical protein
MAALNDDDFDFDFPPESGTNCIGPIYGLFFFCFFFFPSQNFGKGDRRQCRTVTQGGASPLMMILMIMVMTLKMDDDENDEEIRKTVS